MPTFYLTGETPKRLARDLLRLKELPDNGIKVWGNYDAEKDVVEYRVITRGPATDGCFHRIAGTMAALRMDILTAGICTTRDGVVIDTFRVTDNDYEGNVPEQRIAEVAEKIRGVLAQEISVEDMLSRRSQQSVRATTPDVSELEPRVVIDNDCSRDYTVIDVFAYDRPGLLYSLSLALHELQLSVQLARIGTHLDQVVDVFYVTNPEGKKVFEPELTQTITDRLLRVIADANSNAR